MFSVLAACAILTGSLAACGDDATEPLVAPEGSYTLSTIGGVTHPAQLGDTSEGALFIDAGSLVLAADGTFTLSETDRVVDDKSSTTTQINSTGTYTMDGNDITLHYTAPVRTVSGKVATGVVTLTGGGISFVYRK
jgi:hypothetical protein